MTKEPQRGRHKFPFFENTSRFWDASSTRPTNRTKVLERTFTAITHKARYREVRIYRSGDHLWAPKSTRFAQNQGMGNTYDDNMIPVQKKGSRDVLRVSCEQQDWRGPGGKSKSYRSCRSSLLKACGRHWDGFAQNERTRCWWRHLNMMADPKKSHQMGAHRRLAQSWTRLGYAGLRMGTGQKTGRKKDKSFKQDGHEGFHDLRRDKRETLSRTHTTHWRARQSKVDNMTDGVFFVTSSPESYVEQKLALLDGKSTGVTSIPAHNL